MEKSRGVVMDRNISRKLKGKVLDSCEEVGTKDWVVLQNS